jgi:hypothetical protein
MTLILSGTDGLSDVDGSAATPAIRGTDTNTGIFFPAADTIAFSEGGVEAARIDSSGNFRVNNTASMPAAHTAGNINCSNDISTGSFLIGVNNSFLGRQSSDGSTVLNTGQANLIFSRGTYGSTTESARVSSDGSLLVGDTTAAAKLWVYRTDAGNTLGARATLSTYTSTVGFLGADRNTTNNSFYYIDCYNYGAGAYRMRVADSGNVTNANNSYGAISDVKLKENITDATPKLAGLMQVRVRNYSLKSDPSHKQLGVIAQELEQVFPGMVEESPDRDADGNDLGTTTKQVKYSVFVPMLIKAIQEQQAIITALTARVAALEAK